MYRARIRSPKAFSAEFAVMFLENPDERESIPFSCVRIGLMDVAALATVDLMDIVFHDALGRPLDLGGPAWVALYDSEKHRVDVPAVQLENSLATPSAQ